MDARWNTEVVASPDSFTNFDLDPFFEHWADRLQEIRFAMGSGQAVSGLTSASQSPAMNPMAPKQSSVTVSRQIQEATAAAADVDFDAVLAAVPLGTEGSRAVYWVHPEQLVELQVLLLQYTRLAFPRQTPTASTSGVGTPTITPTVTRRSSCSTPRRDSFSDKENCNGIIVFDDAEEYALLQNSVPIAVTEGSQSRPPAEAAMTSRWTNGDLSVTLRHESDTTSSDIAPVSLKLKAKHLGIFLDTEKAFTPPSPLNNDSSGTSSDQDRFTEARKWLSNNRKVVPLVGVFSRRSRFVNLQSGKDSGQWAVLDMDIKMNKVNIGDFQGKEWPTTIMQGATNFPFAVLEIRQEGKANTNLIRILDESHLVSYSHSSGDIQADQKD